MYMKTLPVQGQLMVGGIFSGVGTGVLHGNTYAVGVLVEETPGTDGKAILLKDPSHTKRLTCRRLTFATTCVAVCRWIGVILNRWKRSTRRPWLRSSLSCVARALTLTWTSRQRVELPLKLPHSREPQSFGLLTSERPKLRRSCRMQRKLPLEVILTYFIRIYYTYPYVFIIRILTYFIRNTYPKNTYTSSCWLPWSVRICSTYYWKIRIPLCVLRMKYVWWFFPIFWEFRQGGTNIDTL